MEANHDDNDNNGDDDYDVKDSYHPSLLEAMQQRSIVLQYLSIHPNSTPIEISRDTELHPVLISNALYDLEQRDVISYHKPKWKRGPVKYFIKSEGRFT